MIRIAIPNKGALSEDALALIKSAGYKARREGRELSVTDSGNDIQFLFLRPRDIAVYVGHGIVDLGITGRDLLVDSQSDAREILPLAFGKSRFFYAVPNTSDWSVSDLNGKRIASSYPNIVRRDMEQRGYKCDIVKLDGAVEISIRLGVADAIADVVESGATMRQEGLKTIGEPVMHSEAVIIAANASISAQPQVRTFLKRIKGILTAQTYLTLEYDITEEKLKDACAITPGLESPTVSPLSKKGWFAVKAMVTRNELNDIMDRLEDIGATGIIATDIRTCRV